MVKVDNYINFDNNDDAAEEWGEENYKNWENALSRYEKDSIMKYSEDASLINGLLGGYITISQPEKQKELLTQASYIDAGLNRASIPENVILYRYTDVRELHVRDWNSTDPEKRYYTNEDLYKKDDPTAINPEVKDAIITKLTTDPVLFYSQFISTSLVNNPDAAFSDAPILFYIKAPAKEHVGFLGEGLSVFSNELEMLIATGYKFTVKSITEISGRKKPKLRISILLT